MRAIVVTLACCLLAVTFSNAQQENLRIGLYTDPTWFPLVDYANGTFGGFEPALAKVLCAELEANCTWIPIYTLDGRFASLENDTADVVIAGISVTDERKTDYDLVTPYYLDSGITLFAPSNAINATDGWAAVKNKTVCVSTEYFPEGRAALEAAGLNVLTIPNTSSTVEFEQAVKQYVADGKCIGGAGDSTQVSLFNYANSGLTPILTSPYAIALKKDSPLTPLVTNALVQLMNEGPESEILKLQDEYMVANNIPASANLGGVVNAISNFNASNPAPSSNGNGGGSAVVSGGDGLSFMAVSVVTVIVALIA